jgi:hypothetical protein
MLLFMPLNDMLMFSASFKHYIVLFGFTECVLLARWHKSDVTWQGAQAIRRICPLRQEKLQTRHSGLYSSYFYSVFLFFAGT